MKRNLTLSIAAALMVAGAVAQAEDLESTGSTIVESSMEAAGGGAYQNPYWKDEYPFPREFGRAVD